MRGLGARALRTLVAITVLFVIGVGYLLFGVVQIDPFHQPMVMTVNLARSGGLLDHSQVSYRGFPVGRVREILLRPDGVRVTIGVDEGTRIPVDTDVAVADLSAAGEQYLDFRPRTDHGPYLADGAVIDQRDTSIPVPFTQVLSQVSRLAQQIDPVQANDVVNELAKAFDGSAPDIQRVLDGGDYLLAGLEETLPNTVNALGNGRVVLQTVSDLRGQLVDLGPHARNFTATIRDADPTVRNLVEDSPDTLALIEDVVRKDGPSVATLLGDLGTSTHVMAQRLPALGEFLPSLSTLGPAAKAVVHNGQIGVLLDLYPRPTCDYGTARKSPTIGGSPPPRIHRYCTQQGPRLQQRGSANVPRPHDDDTGRAPKGADPEQRAKDPGGR